MVLARDYQAYMTNREAGSGQRWTLEQALPWVPGPQCGCHESCGCREGEGQLLQLDLKIYHKG